MASHQGPVTVRVADERLDQLSEMYKPKKTTRAEIVLEEMTLEVREGGRRNEWERYVTRLHGSELLVHVLDAFNSGSDPHAALLALDAEMMLADLGIVERMRERLIKEQREPRLVEALAAAQKWLEQERPLRTMDCEPDLRKAMTGFNLVTFIPQLLVLNTPEDAEEYTPDPELLQVAGERRVAAAPLGIAAELALLDPSEQAAFLADLGMSEPAVDMLVREILDQLQLIQFFTVGEDEVRGWLIPRNTPAKVAAGRIHSDLARGFIRAEVVGWQDLIKLGSLPACRSAALLRQEGKTYLVQDGEIMHVKFNV
ncbi:MAG: DUF933 domain-containing protein [Candidatus Alcyoniella australis]|nr:DUF933 domain-containing protein [Candidatus Alcyoniella australis]